MSQFDKVREFHKAFGCGYPNAPMLLTREKEALRLRLIEEELQEYREAAHNCDLVGMLDALADLTYVVLGTAVEHGFVRFDEAFDEVHRSNMSKLVDGKPIKREDGKVLKGPDYFKPNLKPYIGPDTKVKTYWHGTNKWPNAAEGYELYEGPVPDGAYERMVRQD